MPVHKGVLCGINLLTFHYNASADTFRLLAANPAVRQLTGLDLQSQLGKCALELFPRATRAHIDEFKAILKGGKPVRRSDVRCRKLVERWGATSAWKKTA